MIREQAPAKINLYLHVTGKRADGYHVLDSLAVFAQAADVVSIRPADTLSLAIDGPFAAGLSTRPDNLVLRAAQALADAAGGMPGAAITLTKNLPVASGIGGGSADAAASLRGLQKFWRVSLPSATLAAIAASLGADVPVCLDCQAARMGGIGEVLGAAPALPDFGLVLVNPGVAVATPAVFRARAGGFSGIAPLPGAWPDVAAMAAGLAGLTNDLQAAAVALAPEIATVLESLSAEPGILLTRMSGSGATCFGLTATPEEALRCAARLQAAHPGWWVYGGGGF